MWRFHRRELFRHDKIPMGGWEWYELNSHSPWLVCPPNPPLQASLPWWPSLWYLDRSHPQISARDIKSIQISLCICLSTLHPTSCWRKSSIPRQCKTIRPYISKTKSDKTNWRQILLNFCSYCSSVSLLLYIYIHLGQEYSSRDVWFSHLPTESIYIIVSPDFPALS